MVVEAAKNRGTHLDAAARKASVWNLLTWFVETAAESLFHPVAQ
jgi:hypothetical protein